ncbi:unnamed protein product [Clavelina lepadiformis]|uniref:Uncharacterized protein n=1 Tax=Clavelina lepadiformis TaxID=159417 RepID=A0ABP0F0Q2_CLALP
MKKSLHVIKILFMMWLFSSKVLADSECMELRSGVKHQVQCTGLAPFCCATGCCQTKDNPLLNQWWIAIASMFVIFPVVLMGWCFPGSLCCLLPCCCVDAHDGESTVLLGSSSSSSSESGEVHVSIDETSSSDSY